MDRRLAGGLVLALLSALTFGTSGWALGPYTFFAQAQDLDGALSTAVMTTAVVQNPVILVGDGAARSLTYWDAAGTQVTITNPELLAQPYVTRIAYKLDNEFPMREYVCSENNRLQSGENGANIDLGFDHLDEPDPFGPPPAGE